MDSQKGRGTEAEASYSISVTVGRGPVCVCVGGRETNLTTADSLGQALGSLEGQAKGLGLYPLGTRSSGCS